MKASGHGTNTSRAQAATATRRRVVAAAEALLLSRGWAGTTIRAVASRAGVSPETVYKGFGGKAALLKAAYDLRIAGDDRPVPIAEREGVARLKSAGSPSEAAEAWADHALAILAKSSDIMALALGAQASEPELAEFLRVTDTERMTGAAATAEHWGRAGWLRVPLKDARERIWLLGSPSTYLDRRTLGWNEPRQRAWLRDCLLALVLNPDARPTPGEAPPQGGPA